MKPNTSLHGMLLTSVQFLELPGSQALSKSQVQSPEGTCEPKPGVWVTMWLFKSLNTKLVGQVWKDWYGRSLLTAFVFNLTDGSRSVGYFSIKCQSLAQVRQGLSKDDLDLLCQQVCTELSETQKNLFFYRRQKMMCLQMFRCLI